MTLSERIGTADPGEIFCVGSASGFVFIGDKEEFERDIRSASRFFYKFFRSTLEKDVKKLKEFERKLGPEISDEESRWGILEEKLGKLAKECSAAEKAIECMIDTTTVPWLFSALDGVKDDIHELLRICRKYPKDRDATESFIPIEEREIKEEYIRVQGETVLIVDGYENGGYWLREEYENEILPYALRNPEECEDVADDE